ncbi:MAG: FecCD family ABC transporter permease [Calditrichia bacterium]
MKIHPRLLVLMSLLFLIIVLVVAPFIGSQSLNYREVWQFIQGSSTPDGLIFFRIRLPRILLGVLAGASLSLAGVIFQALLRNPLATPYTLGVSSGGALGALVAIKSGLAVSLLGFSSIQVAAFFGSLLTILLVYLLARRVGKLSIHIMILAGVTISYFIAAVNLMLHYLADFTETHQMIRWMMGGLDIVNYTVLMHSFPVLLIAFVGLWSMARTYNILSTSEETALSKGVNVARIQKLSFVLASVMTGTVVALCGPIGFVGLIVPHLIRIAGGPDHRFLIPSSVFFGGAFLALADTFARTLLAPIDLPVGILTALIGGPFFLWLLFRQRI